MADVRGILSAAKLVEQPSDDQGEFTEGTLEMGEPTD